MIKVGGASEIEVKERKDRVDDALHATRAAVEEGIVPGGGVALLYAIKALDGLTGANEDQTRGIDIVRKAIQSPVRQIAENAGHDGAVVAGKLIDGNDESLGLQRRDRQVREPGCGRRHRPDQGRARRAPGRGFGRGPADHHRGGDQRASRRQAGDADARRRRHGRHGRHGLLRSGHPTDTRKTGPGERSSGLFRGLKGQKKILGPSPQTPWPARSWVRRRLRAYEASEDNFTRPCWMSPRRLGTAQSRPKHTEPRQGVWGDGPRIFPSRFPLADPTAMLSINRALPIRAATSNLAGASPRRMSGASVFRIAQFGVIDRSEPGRQEHLHKLREREGPHRYPPRSRRSHRASRGAVPRHRRAPWR